MNFPDVPFDENLFSSNEMLKSYWERSTEKRLEATIPDYPSEESFRKNDLEEESLKLWAPKVQRSASKVSKAEEVAEAAKEVAEPADSVVLYEPKKSLKNGASVDALVEAKSTAGVLTIVFACIGGSLIIAYIVMSFLASGHKKRY